MSRSYASGVRASWDKLVMKMRSENVFSRELIPYWFILPYMIIFLGFWGWPLIWSPLMSLQEYSLSGSTWTGLSHYEVLLYQPDFLRSIVNTFAISALTIPITIGTSLMLAIIVNSTYIKLKSQWRTVFLSPLIVSGVIIAFIALIFFGADGIINLFLRAQYGTTIDWVTGKWPSRFVVALISSYNGIAISFLFFLSGLAGIPNHLYNAARIDGANKIQQFWHITLPQLRSMLVLVLILQTNGALKIFAAPDVISGIQTANPHIRVIVMELFRTSFVQFQLGRGAAMGMVLTLMISIIIIIEYVVGEDNE